MVDANRRRLTVGRADPTIKSVGASGNSQDGFLSKFLAEEQKQVTCIHSVTDQEKARTKSFAEKRKAFCENGAAVDTCPAIQGVNVTCKKGMKPESPNQDSYVVINSPGKWGLYGVFDGHGPMGHDVSDFAVKTLVKNFLGQEGFQTNPGDVFTNAFTDCQKEIEAVMPDQAKSSGTTCTMAFHDLEKDILTVAHVGDSRAVLYHSGKGAPEDSLTVIHGTEDHKPNLPGEKARIERMGGRVVFDGYYNYRVFAKAGMYPGLNMSRALGDIIAHKEAGLTAEPELKVFELASHRDKSPLTLVIASDGVWEFIENNQAPQYLKENGAFANTQQTVNTLAKESWDRWMKDSDNEISDDITVVEVTL